MTKPLILLGKFVATISAKFNLGSGQTWPGHIALKLNRHFISEMLDQAPTKVIFVVGTNGKTTTSLMLATILKEDGKRVFRNSSGANLLNGIASSLLLHTNKQGKITHDYAVFEVDENFLPLILKHVTPSAIIALDLFRDQLDRYGELDSIAKKWNVVFKQLPEESKLILNADDPLVAYLAKEVRAKVFYFGLEEKEAKKQYVDQSADSVYCPNCLHKLNYKGVFYSHLGLWSCPSCGIKRPLPHLSQAEYPLSGTYNEYNTLAAVLTAKELTIPQKVIDEALKQITPAFGRQEKLRYEGREVIIFLSKNPTSMNESLRTVIQQKGKHILFVLNDRIPDGQDVSWIWDIDIESYVSHFGLIAASGDRMYDMALRLQYAGVNNILIEDKLEDAIVASLSKLPANETLYILPTYSAMLDSRKILTGKKIL